MDNYEILGKIGEGTYGVVLKARHKETQQIVAIKKIKESDKDESVRKTALREVRILKQLKHENIVGLIEVFRRKGKLHLVFEYVERTILEDLEANPDGLDGVEVKKIIFQLVRSIEFCHSHNVIHRDIKPENLLVSKNGVLKLCDFGFARNLAGPGARYTDYVSTRWYRAPELLVGDQSYGKPVDIWAIGCMMAELITGLPLFPGESDIDQLFHIVQCFGSLTPHMMELMRKNPLFVGVQMPEFVELETLEKKLPSVDPVALDLIYETLHYEPERRTTCAGLLAHEYFDGFEEWFAPQLAEALEKDGNLLATKRRRRKERKHSDAKPFNSTAPAGSASVGMPVGTPTLLSTTDELPRERSKHRHSVTSIEESKLGGIPALDTSSLTPHGASGDEPLVSHGKRFSEDEELTEARADLRSRRSERDRDRGRSRDRSERKLDLSSRGEKEERDRLQSRDRKRDHGHRHKGGDVRDKTRRHLPNLQAQRMVAFPSLMTDGEAAEDDTKAFRTRVKDSIPSIGGSGMPADSKAGREFKGFPNSSMFPTVRETKTFPSPSGMPAAAAGAGSGGVGISVGASGLGVGGMAVGGMAVGGMAAGGMAASGMGASSAVGAPSPSMRHARHSSHGTGFKPQGYYQPSGYMSKPPTHRVPQFATFGMSALPKPPSSRGQQRNSFDALGLLNPPRTAHESRPSGGISGLRGSGAPLGSIYEPLGGGVGGVGGGGSGADGAAGYGGHLFAGSGVKLL